MAGWEVRWSTLEAMDSAARRGRSITTTEWTERRCNDHQQTGNSSGDVLRGARIINLEAVSPAPRGSIWDAMVEQNPELGTKYRSLDEMIHHPELADPKARAKRDAEERAMDALHNLFPSRGNGRLR